MVINHLRSTKTCLGWLVPFFVAKSTVTDWRVIVLWIHLEGVKGFANADVAMLNEVEHAAVPQLADTYSRRKMLHASPSRGKVWIWWCDITTSKSFFSERMQTFWLKIFSPPVRWGLLDFMSACRPSSRSFSSSPCPPPASPDLNHDYVRSVLRAGPQLRSREFSVACRTSTAILWDQCCVPDLNCDPVSSVLRAGPQPRSCEISVACRTSTAIPCVQCCAPDLNRDPVSSVLRAGPQPRSCEISVACRTSTAIPCVQCCCRSSTERMSEDRSQRMPNDMSERMSKDMSERMSGRSRENSR